MLKRYFTWLKEALPQEVWESLEEELNCFEESLPHMRETPSPWIGQLAIVGWLVSLTFRGFQEYVANKLFAAWKWMVVLCEVVLWDRNKSRRDALETLLKGRPKRIAVEYTSPEKRVVLELSEEEAHLIREIANDQLSTSLREQIRQAKSLESFIQSQG